MDKASLTCTLTSFGHKYGPPSDADLVFDVRTIPNPYWDSELRALSGNDEPVHTYVMGQIVAVEMMDALATTVNSRLKCMDDPADLRVAVGCTGGRHRSVVIVKELAKRIAAPDVVVRICHRDIDRDLGFSEADPA